MIQIIPKTFTYTGFLVHGFLTNSMLSIILLPIIKDKAGKLNSLDND